MDRKVQLYLILFCGLCCCNAKELPSYIEKCSRKDPIKLGECIKQRAEDIKPRLLKGIPELKLPPIEPLHIPKLEINTGNGASVTMDAVLSDVLINGVREFTISNLEFNFDANTIFLQFHLPRLEIVGDYMINGKVLLFEINSKGKVEANITNIDATNHMDFSVITKNGKEYIKFDASQIERKYDKISLYFHDLLSNNELTQEVNKVINERIDIMTEEVNPFAFEAVHKLITGILEPIFEEHSVNELFAD